MLEHRLREAPDDDFAAGLYGTAAEPGRKCHSSLKEASAMKCC
jgi:hypothetical protein